MTLTSMIKNIQEMQAPVPTKLSRPYLASAGIENEKKFICCINPLMSSILAESEFIEADITYNETK